MDLQYRLQSGEREGVRDHLRVSLGPGELVGRGERVWTSLTHKRVSARLKRNVAASRGSASRPFWPQVGTPAGDEGGLGGSHTRPV